MTRHHSDKLILRGQREHKALVVLVHQLRYEIHEVAPWDVVLLVIAATGHDLDLIA